MRKSIFIAIAFISVVSFSSLAFASGDSYEISEFDFDIKMPDDWITLTREIDADDEKLVELGLDYDYIITQFNQNYIYLNSVRMEPLTEIIVTVLEHENYEEILNFANLSEKELISIGEYFIGEKKETIVDAFKIATIDIDNSSFESYNIYKSGKIVYLVLDSKKTFLDQLVNEKQYTTIVNGKLISIALKEYQSEVTESDASKLKEVVDSLTFGHIDVKKTGFLDQVTSSGTIKSVVSSLLLAVGVAIIIVVLTNRSIAKTKK